MTKLRADLAFDLSKMLMQIKPADLGLVEGSPFKAVTMKRKVLDILKETNKEYSGKLDEMGKILNEGSERYNAYKAELDAIEGKSEEEKLAETKVYTESIDKEMMDKFNLLGKPFVIKNGDSQVLGLQSDVVIELPFEDRHVAFLKERVDKQGISHFNSEQDLLDVGAALGME